LAAGLGAGLAHGRMTRAVLRRVLGFAAAAEGCGCRVLGLARPILIGWLCLRGGPARLDRCSTHGLWPRNPPLRPAVPHERPPQGSPTLFSAPPQPVYSALSFFFISLDMAPFLAAGGCMGEGGAPGGVALRRRTPMWHRMGRRDGPAPGHTLAVSEVACHPPTAPCRPATAADAAQRSPALGRRRERRLRAWRWRRRGHS
jgi:hypothetical protein